MNPEEQTPEKPKEDQTPEEEGANDPSGYVPPEGEDEEDLPAELLQELEEDDEELGGAADETPPGETGSEAKETDTEKGKESGAGGQDDPDTVKVPEFKSQEEATAYAVKMAGRHKNAEKRMHEEIRLRQKAESDRTKLIESAGGPQPGEGQPGATSEPPKEKPLAQKIEERTQRIMKSHGLDEDQSRVFATELETDKAEEEATRKESEQQTRLDNLAKDRSVQVKEDWKTVSGFKDFAELRPIMARLLKEDKEVQQDIKFIHRPANYLAKLARSELQGEGLKEAKEAGRKEALTRKKASAASVAVEGETTPTPLPDEGDKDGGILAQIEELTGRKIQRRKPGTGLDFFKLGM